MAEENVMGGGEETKDEIIARLLAAIEKKDAIIESLERIIISSINN